jgi:UDP-N-acetylmuramate-alanine ligase
MIFLKSKFSYCNASRLKHICSGIIFRKWISIKKREQKYWHYITKDFLLLCSCGTHGKTTTSSILGHILYECGVDVTAFIGGIVENYNLI